MVRVGVLGAGYWGPNLIRNFAELRSLAGVCEVNPQRLERARARFPWIAAFTAYEEMLEAGDVDAVAIATPVENHFAHARAALAAGKHVLVEKPLATTVQECLELIRLAAESRRVLMVGHTFLYNPSVRRVKELIETEELGTLHYVYSQRLNLGIIRQDINAMWNLAPHDLSIIGYLIERGPLRVAARGFTYLQDGLPDVVFLTVEYPDDVAAHIHVSWLDPQRVRRMTFVGSRRMVVYDDVNLEAKVQIYDRGVDRVETGNHAASRGFGEYQLLVRSGDLFIPKIEAVEPLMVECAHFIECAGDGRTPLSDGWDGLRVVAMLEAAERSMALGGVPVEVAAGFR